MDKEKELTKSFINLDEKFGSTFELEQNNIVPVEEEKPKTFEVNNQAPDELEGSKYITSELEIVIESISDVMDKLGEDIKIGSPPRMFEVYAKLVESKIKAIDSLTNKSKANLDAKIKSKNNQIVTNNKTTNNIMLSSKDLLGILVKENPKTNTLAKIDDNE